MNTCQLSLEILFDDIRLNFGDRAHRLPDSVVLYLNDEYYKVSIEQVESAPDTYLAGDFPDRIYKSLFEAMDTSDRTYRSGDDLVAIYDGEIFRAKVEKLNSRPKIDRKCPCRRGGE